NVGGKASSSLSCFAFWHLAFWFWLSRPEKPGAGIIIHDDPRHSNHQRYRRQRSHFKWKIWASCPSTEATFITPEARLLAALSTWIWVLMFSARRAPQGAHTTASRPTRSRRW